MTESQIKEEFRRLDELTEAANGWVRTFEENICAAREQIDYWNQEIASLSAQKSALAEQLQPLNKDLSK